MRPQDPFPFPDSRGVFAADGKGPPAFVALDPPTDDEVAALTLQIIRRVVKSLARHQENAGDENDLADALAAAQAATVQPPTF